MIKKQQKWIALLVVCTFMWLMQVSTMPLAAADSSETASFSSIEQGPDYYEAVGQKAAPAKKKSILPWILIGVGVIAVTAVVLFLVVLKGYDIVGTWSGTMAKWDSGSWTSTAIFSGEKKSGTLLYSEPAVSNASGTYTVDGKNVSFSFTVYGQTVSFTGVFDSKDKMSGTWKNSIYPDIYGNWNFTRAGSSAQLPTIQSFGIGTSVFKNK